MGTPETRSVRARAALRDGPLHRFHSAGLRYLKLITPNSPAKLLSGPALKKS
jgi:hypothetical protein